MYRIYLFLEMILGICSKKALVHKLT